MPRPLIEPLYKRKETDFLKELYERITLNEITEKYLWENTLHIYFIGVTFPFVLPEKYRVRLKRENRIPGFPVDIVFHPNEDLILKETRYDKNSKESDLTNPILFVTYAVNTNDKIFKYLFMDDIAIHKKNGSEILISKSQCEGSDKDLYNFNYGALVYELNMDQLYYFITGNNPGKHNEINYNSNEIASYKELILHEDGTISEDGKKVGKIDISRKSKLGKFNFLKYLMIKQGRERSNKLVPQEEITANVGGNDFEKMYSKINNENLKYSSYKISKSGTGYMIKRK